MSLPPSTSFPIKGSTDFHTVPPANRKSSIVNRKLTILILLLLLTCAVTPRPASAHPADMYAQTQSIVLTSAGLQLDWSILPGPFLADAVWAAADLDQNGSISHSEAQAWVAPFLSAFTLNMDGRQVDLVKVENIHWPAAVAGLRTGDDAVQVALRVAWPSGLTGSHTLEIHNAHLEPNSLNSFSITASDGLTFDRPTQDNGHLSLNLIVPTAAGATGGSPSPTTGPLPSSASRLTSWTSGTPNLPDFTASLSKLATDLSSQQPAATSIGRQYPG